MARKKKQVQQKQQYNSPISYSGKITVTVKNGNTIISKNTYKNNGGLNLWYFLCASLAGQYTNADQFRPYRIMLYYCKDETVPTSIENLDQDNFVKLTSEIPINRASEVLPIKESGKTINYTATLHFLIPPAYFNAVENAKINTVVLYGKKEPTTPNKDNYSAYYFFAKDGAWDTPNILNLDDIKDNYNIIIDWEMSVDNR